MNLKGNTNAWASVLQTATDRQFRLEKANRIIQTVNVKMNLNSQEIEKSEAVVREVSEASKLL
jgi:hypothetical protein